MPATLRFDGMDDFRQALTHLPEELATKAAAVVVAAAQETGHALATNYPLGPPRKKHESGNLKRGVKVIVRSNNKFSARATVVSAAYHAHLYENGTKERFFNGASRGSMPQGPEANRLIPRAIRARRSMTEQLIEIVREAGLTVTQ